MRNGNMWSYKDLNKNVPSSFVHNNQNLEWPTCPSTGESIIVQWTLDKPTIHMNLKNNTLSEKSLTQRNPYDFTYMKF